MVVEAEEKTVGREEEVEAAAALGRCPFPVADCLSRSEPAEGKTLCRSASACPGV